MVAGRHEHRRAARDPERREREIERIGVHALGVEQIARQQDGVHPARDCLAHDLIERASLLAPPLVATLRRQPAERAAEVEIGDLQEFRERHRP